MVTLISSFLIGSLTVTSRTGPSSNNKTDFGRKVTMLIHVLFGSYVMFACFSFFYYSMHPIRYQSSLFILVQFIQDTTKTLVLPIYM